MQAGLGILEGLFQYTWRRTFYRVVNVVDAVVDLLCAPGLSPNNRRLVASRPLAGLALAPFGPPLSGQAAVTGIRVAPIADAGICHCEVNPSTGWRQLIQVGVPLSLLVR